MSTQYPDVDSSMRPRRSLVSFLLLAVIAFAAGLAFMVWMLSRWPTAGEMLGVTAPPPAVTEQASPPVSPPFVLQEPVATAAADPELNRRVALLEQRLGAVANRASEAVGNADRAESLLVAFAARRAIDRGVGLGYLEAMLRQRFGDNQPQAVATIIVASRQPVTLQHLQQQLIDMSSDLVVAGPRQNWWGALRQQVSDLVTIRHRDSPSTMPSERLLRAQQRLEMGQVNVAMAELNRLPGREAARAWFDAARRYIAAHDALDRIETAALVEERTTASAAAMKPPSPAATPAPAQAN